MDEIARGQPEDLARLLALRDASGGWTHDELRDMLRHQLSTPLRVEFGDRACAATPDLPHAATFGDLFAHPSPPVATLMLAKEFAKTADVRSDAPLPSELAAMIYYVAIAVARVRLGVRITNLPASDELNGLDWAASRDWLTPELAQVVRACIAHIRSSPSKPG